MMQKLINAFKKNPFSCSWLIFLLLLIFTSYQEIEPISSYLYLIILSIPYFYFYIFKPFLFIKDKRKFSIKFQAADKWKLFIVIVFSIGMPGVGMIAYYGYENAEIKAVNQTYFEPTYLDISKKYKHFSKKEAKELSVKMYLLKECEGGQKTIAKHTAVDRNALATSCSAIIHLKRNEIIIDSKSKLENLTYLNKVDFKKGLKKYSKFINE